MYLDPIQINKSWAQFIKLSNIAKARNAGFNVPIVSKRKPFSNNGKNITQNNAQVVSAMKKLYDIHVPKKNIPIVGTQFDVYA